MAQTEALSAKPPSPLTKILLPHPYYTAYEISPSKLRDGQQLHQLRKAQTQKKSGIELAKPLHNDNLYFSSLDAPGKEEQPPLSNNTAWARAKRALASTFSWDNAEAPSLGQAWLVVYALFTLRPEIEYFRLSLKGSGSENLRKSLLVSSLATSHPSQVGQKPNEADASQILVLRGTFWQGAGAPFGLRSAWVPNEEDESSTENVDRISSSNTVHHVLTTRFPSTQVHRWHPDRPAKPKPGSVIYSRYIHSLDEHFSMVHLDYENDEHLQLFHKWQNDPRVAKGWNEEGTLDQHRQYLKNMYEDPHQIAILAAFEGVFFAYFEVYWAKEDHMGIYFDADDFDRGRHSLVGDVRFRGRYRVTAWWSSLMHFIFLDDPRTMSIVGEPKATNSSVLAYDLMTGFNIEKFIDLPHKRSALMRCSRERFFQLSPLDTKGGYVAGTDIRLPAKL